MSRRIDFYQQLTDFYLCACIPLYQTASVGYVLIVRHATHDCLWMWPRNGVRPLRSPTITRTLVSCILTTLSYLTDVHALLCCHEAQHREHHEACKEAGSTVDYSQYKCISAEKCEEKNGEWEGEQWLTLWAKREREPYQYVVTWALCELFKIATGSRKDGEWKGSSNYSESYCCFAVGRYRTETTMTILSLHNTDPSSIALNIIAYIHWFH